MNQINRINQTITVVELLPVPQKEKKKREMPYGPLFCFEDSYTVPIYNFALIFKLGNND